jgi:hypothetical protein
VFLKVTTTERVMHRVTVYAQDEQTWCATHLLCVLLVIVMFSLALLYLIFTITVYSAAYRVAGHYMMMRRVCARRVGCDHTRIDLGWISLVQLFRSSSLSPSPPLPSFLTGFTGFAGFGGGGGVLLV